MNNTELKCYKWLMNSKNIPSKEIEFSENHHTFVTNSEIYYPRMLQTDRITLAAEDIEYLKKQNVTVIVFSITSLPISMIPINEIDFRHNKWNNIKVYTMIKQLAGNVRLTASQYEELMMVKQLFESDFGHLYSFGDTIHSLCMGYITGRSVIMKESQPVMVNDATQ